MPIASTNSSGKDAKTPKREDVNGFNGVNGVNGFTESASFRIHSVDSFHKPFTYSADVT